MSSIENTFNTNLKGPSNSLWYNIFLGLSSSNCKERCLMGQRRIEVVLQSWRMQWMIWCEVDINYAFKEGVLARC
jgi:hypothetical protein